MKAHGKAAAVILVFVLFLPYAGSAAAAPGGNRSVDNVFVKWVNDGDTVTVEIGGHDQKIRLIGIDAPEMGQAPWGDISRRRLKAMVLSSSRRVRLEYDLERRDKYGRLLAYLWTKEGKLLNAEMLRNGYAVLFTVQPDLKHLAEFVAAEKQARSRKRGVWQGDGLREKPVQYRREHPRIR